MTRKSDPLEKLKALPHVFVTDGEPIRSNWREAFPQAQLGYTRATSCEASVVWVLLPYTGDITPLIRRWQRMVGDAPVVALSDEPRDEEGMVALRAGVSGYCNGYASPAVLQQVAETVLQGGVWLGQSLLQKLVATTAQNLPKPAVAPLDWTLSLTEREVIVARAVASGASNKEIADQLNITERTVKAHLTAAFEKLRVRDRLQLTLLVNGITELKAPS